MVKVVFLALYVSINVTATQQIDLIEIKIEGKFNSYEVTDFPYEGVLVVDVSGDISGFSGTEWYENSFLRSAEYRKMGSNTGRIIFKFSAPCEVQSHSYSGNVIFLVVEAKGARVQLSPLSPKVSSLSPHASEKIVTLRETVFVNNSLPVRFRFRNLNSSEIAKFVKIAIGRETIVPKDALMSGFVEASSIEEFVKKIQHLPEYAQ